MSDIEKIQLFEQKKIRTAWDEEKQEWFFSIVDVCGVLTGQPDYDLAKNYWKVLKHRLIKEGNESVTKCNQLKLPSPKDGKRYATDVADMALMFRIIESIPSKKAEPIKVWMAAVAAERINQAIDPERSIDQAIADYRRLGYSEAWITRRIKTIEIRKGLIHDADARHRRNRAAIEGEEGRCGREFPVPAQRRFQINALQNVPVILPSLPIHPKGAVQLVRAGFPAGTG